MDTTTEQRPHVQLASRRKKRERRWIDRILALAGMDRLSRLPEDVRETLTLFGDRDGPDQGALAN